MAKSPTLSLLGKAAIIKEPSAIKITLKIIELLRPILSANEPKSHEPIGRIKKPSAKIPKAFIC